MIPLRAEALHYAGTNKTPQEMTLEEIHFPLFTSSDLIRLNSPTGKDLSFFQLGDVLRGEVIEVVDDRHAVIRMGGHDLSVESRVPLERGMEGLFKVKTIYPQIVLNLLQTEEMNPLEAERRLIALLMTGPSMEDISERLSVLWKTGGEGMAPDVRETMNRLLGLWTSFLPSGSFTTDPGQIEKMVAQSGLFFENHMEKLIEAGGQSRIEEVLGKDVKGLLVKLKGQLETPSPAARTLDSDPAIRERLLDSVNHLLHKIESAQLFHSPSPSRVERDLFLLLPFWVQERLQLVDLHLSLPQSGPDRPDTEGMSMLFLLHLPEWGRMSIEVRMIKKKLYGRFFFASDEVASFFSRTINELQRRLLHLGFQPELRVSTQTPEKMVENFVNEIKGSDRSLVNLVV